ncbi:unnamed protein product [Rhizopus stolonifer]
MIRGNNPINVTMEAFFSLTGHSTAQPAQLIAHYRQLAQTAIKKEHLHTDLEKLVHYQCVFASNNLPLTTQNCLPLVKELIRSLHSLTIHVDRMPLFYLKAH